MKRGVVSTCISHKPFILRRVSLFTTITTLSGSQVVKNFQLGLFQTSENLFTTHYVMNARCKK